MMGTVILHMSFGGKTYTVTDSRGKVWSFEYHWYLGPTVLNKDGSPRVRQPGIKSPFWAALDKWTPDADHRNCTCTK